MPNTDDSVRYAAESKWLRFDPSPREQIATTSLHQSSCVTLKALIRTASGEEGGRNTETEVTTIEGWLEGLQ